MNIVLLGKGNMGGPLATLLAKAGHAVSSLGSKDDQLELLKVADLVILAVKYEQALELVRKPGVAERLSGKTVIDLTNPLAPDYMSLTIGHSTSAAEEIGKALPGARVVKAFNTVFASLLARRAAGGTVEVPVFVAGNDTDAVETVMLLSRSLGFKTINGGALSNSRYLEAMAEFMIQLGYGLGHGSEIGFGVITVA